MATIETPIVVIAECGTRLREGDRAYSHYTMSAGTIEEVGTDGWFNFRHDDGKASLLNGQRVCSMPFARLRNFKGADSA